MALTKVDSRPWPTIRVSELGFEDGSKRFRANDAGDPTAPSVCFWRNNLTALSQRYNLYFVACRDKVYVYRPSFPIQVLSNHAALVFAPPLAEPDKQGHIDPHFPHGINNILVGDLGDEEILLLSCDDGNVSAVHTRIIFNEIERRGSPETMAHNGHDIRGFFSQYVGLSAWGLAIHKMARMIAVSSNTGDITVFAFALVDPSADLNSAVSEEDTLMEDLSEWRSYSSYPSITGSVNSTSRSHNIIITLRGHRENIPSISFFDSDHDPNGRWLVSTDIRGNIRIWDVWLDSRGFCKGSYPGWAEGAYLSRSSSGSYEVFDGSERGWSVICLDSRAFRQAWTMSEALGMTAPRTNLENTPPIYTSGSAVPNVSGYYAGQRSQEGLGQSSADPDPDLFGFIGVIAGSDETDSDFETTGENIDLISVEDLVSDSASPLVDEEEIIEGDFGDEQGDEEYSDDSDNESNEWDSRRKVRGSQDEPLIAATSRHHSEVTGPATSIRESQTSSSGGPLKSDHPPFIILHSTEADIFLYSNPLSPQPSVCSYRAVAQELSPQISWLNRIHRLNMALQIPELGVVILGTQTGRVVVLALTNLNSSETYAFRQEWILPFKSQETRGQRPECPLLGIAAAPLQGREATSTTTNPFPESADNFNPSSERESWRGVEASRRYRLLLTYYDHSVLSYELSWGWNDLRRGRNQIHHEEQDDQIII